MSEDKFDLNKFQLRFRGCILRLDMAVHYVHNCNWNEFFLSYKNMLTLITECMETVSVYGDVLKENDIYIVPADFLELISGLLKSQEMKDYILLSDLLEMQVRPYLVAIMEQLQIINEGNIILECFEENIKALEIRSSNTKQEIIQYYEKIKGSEENGEYVVENTSSGYPTLKICKGNREWYYYSNNNPHMPIIKWLENQIKEADRYHVLGIGLGYEFHHLYLISGKSVPIEVYESNISLIAIAMNTLRMDYSLRDKVRIHYDPKLTKIKEAFGKPGEQVLLYPPAIQNISNIELRRSFEKFKILEDSHERGHILLNGNFTQNQLFYNEHKDEVSLVDDLKDFFEGKTVYIVAAGPSLDCNIELLKQRASNSIVLATGTVFSKLMSISIRPDYVIITDPNERVLDQVYGLEQSGVPLLLLSTANEKFMKRYQGRKYLIYQKDYPKAEAEAKSQKAAIYGTGGSVSTTALDLAISLRARNIIFLGLDLAYTNQLAHASGTSNQLAADETDLIPVKGWGDKQVYTNEKFISYREWIEHRLKEKDCEGITIINATEGGSYIKGLKHEQLQNVIQM